MRFPTTITSKGTITIASEVRKAFDLRPGQKVDLVMDKGKIFIEPGMTIEQFEKIRDEIVSRIPKHKKGLSMSKMRELAAKNWLADRKK
jgi:AbrB family looped-hinge helix DNA binding protein